MEYNSEYDEDVPPAEPWYQLLIVLALFSIVFVLIKFIDIIKSLWKLS